MGSIDGANDAGGAIGDAQVRWRLPGVLTALGALSSLLGDAGREWLRWDRDGLADGQLWRVLSGHFVHLGWPHFILNAIGLWCVWLLVGRNLATRDWLLVLLAQVAAIDLGFWYLDPGLAWYVGLSGLLHGLLMAGLVSGFRTAPVESAVIGALVVFKLAYEQMAGPLPGSEATAGGAVVVNAHLYGAIAGAASGIVLSARVRGHRSI